MGTSTGIFQAPEVAVMVTVVLITAIVTPLLMRGTFMIKYAEDNDDHGRGATASYSPTVKSQAEA